MERPGAGGGDRPAQHHPGGGRHIAAVRGDEQQFVGVAEPARLVQDLCGAADVEEGHPVEDEEGDASGHVRIRGSLGRMDMAQRT
ncbi:hypothetical protein Smic_66190 [Streptomyces microflavus]|uniref:Uncharacterized protein n=1 Tax=Streptomyces microflavus TaxID=1919 RepID=A0A7J0D020_STRMI|nr:hypothetical protein Smic_66190 [Streptomyces microflavus]